MAPDGQWSFMMISWASGRLIISVMVSMAFGWTLLMLNML